MKEEAELENIDSSAPGLELDGKREFVCLCGRYRRRAGFQVMSLAACLRDRWRRYVGVWLTRTGKDDLLLSLFPPTIHDSVFLSTSLPLSVTLTSLLSYSPHLSLFLQRKRGRVLRRAVKETEMVSEHAQSSGWAGLPTRKALPTELLIGSSLQSIEAEGPPPQSKRVKSPHSASDVEQTVTTTTKRAKIKVKANISNQDSNLGGSEGELWPGTPSKTQPKVSESKRMKLPVSTPNTPTRGQLKVPEPKSNIPKPSLTAKVKTGTDVKSMSTRGQPNKEQEKVRSDPKTEKSSPQKGQPLKSPVKEIGRAHV